MKPIMWIFSGLLLTLLVLAAGISHGSAGTVTPTPMPTPSGVVLFEDDFSTFSSRWREPQTAKAVVAYDNEGLRMQVNSPDVAVWSVPDFDVPLANYHAEVTVTFVDGSRASFFGWVVFYESDENFVTVGITPDGDWQVRTWQDGIVLDIPPEDAAPGETGGAFTLEPGQTTFSIQLDVQSTTLCLVVNNAEPVVFVLDERPAGESFGLFAQAREGEESGSGFVDIVFDDVLVIDWLERAQDDE
ncbi:MAG: hypothetical protein GYB65_07830 [Chloroflexi bacterium]|nr:hypothetical protein [Chloroflexota bacterium]